MKVRRHAGSFLVAALLATPLASAPLAAQSVGGWAVGMHGSAGLFVGSSSDFLDAEYGLDVSLSRSFAPHVQLRADVMLMGLDDVTDPFETADNRVIVVGLGPEVHASLGSVSFYARGLVGVAANQQLRTNSPLEELTTWASAFGAGAGIRFGLSTAATLDIGGDVLKLGELDFARRATSSLLYAEDPALLRLRAGVRFALG
jgi:opacity protein-like surface antigen